MTTELGIEIKNFGQADMNPTSVKLADLLPPKKVNKMKDEYSMEKVMQGEEDSTDEMRITDESRFTKSFEIPPTAETS